MWRHNNFERNSVRAQDLKGWIRTSIERTIAAVNPPFSTDVTWELDSSPGNRTPCSVITTHQAVYTGKFQFNDLLFSTRTARPFALPIRLPSENPPKYVWQSYGFLPEKPTKEFCGEKLLFNVTWSKNHCQTSKPYIHYLSPKWPKSRFWGRFILLWTENKTELSNFARISWVFVRLTSYLSGE